MPNDQGFMDAICAEPLDIGLHLIYADWLEDQGQEDRAEFIRLQCRLGELETISPDFAALCNREKQLEERLRPLIQRQLSQHPLLGKVAPRLRWWFDRGLVGRVVCRAADWLNYGPLLVRWQPVVQVTLEDTATHIAGSDVYLGVVNLYLAIDWARGAHPDLGLTALPPLPLNSRISSTGCTVGEANPTRNLVWGSRSRRARDGPGV